MKCGKKSIKNKLPVKREKTGNEWWFAMLSAKMASKEKNTEKVCVKIPSLFVQEVDNLVHIYKQSTCRIYLSICIIKTTLLEIIEFKIRNAIASPL